VTYNEKHNEANGEENRDGSSDNKSWNCGLEGPTDDVEVNRLRERQLRNFFAALLLSQGTLMLLAGDEFGRTQKGNNNAYCQDTEISWLDWNITEKGKSLIQFVKKLTDLRHRYPILRRNRFLAGQYVEEVGVKDVTWINANGSEMTAEQWQDGGMACLGMLLDGRAQATGIRKSSKDATLLMVINGHSDLVEFALPECYGGMQWSLLLDANIADSTDLLGFSASLFADRHSAVSVLRKGARQIQPVGGNKFQDLCSRSGTTGSKRGSHHEALRA